MSYISELKALDEKLNGRDQVPHRDSHLEELRKLGARLDRGDAEEFEANQRFRRVFKHSNIGICLVSEEGYFLEVNPKCCDIWQRSEDQLLELKWQEITHPDYIETDYDNTVELAHTSAQTYRMYKQYLAPDGEVIHAILTVSAINDKRGRFLYFVSQIQDLNEMRELIKKYGLMEDGR